MYSVHGPLKTIVPKAMSCRGNYHVNEVLDFFEHIPSIRTKDSI